MVGFTLIQCIEVLVGEKFFNSCLVHGSEKKNEKNTFCLDCCTSLCSHCLFSHQNHRLLQIRRYVYQDVIRLSDAQKLLDCSTVQSYTTNKAKVVFLKQRPVTRQFKGYGNICISCHRNLQDPYLFCSVSCKVHHTQKTKVGPRKQLFYGSEFHGNRHFSFPELAGGQMTPDSVLELPTSSELSSSSSTTVSIPNYNNNLVRKKRSPVSVSRIRCRPVYAPPADYYLGVNRRKGVPQRSPMY